MTLAESQKPIKMKLADNPDKAIVTLTSTACLSDRLCWKASNSRFNIEAGLPMSAGGIKETTSPGVLFLSSLGVCAGITLSATAEYMRINITSGKVIVSGELDMRGTMGVSENSPIGFLNIKIDFELESDADDDQLQLLLESAAKYSVNCNTVENKTIVNYSITRSDQLH